MIKCKNSEWFARRLICDKAARRRLRRKNAYGRERKIKYDDDQTIDGGKTSSDLEEKKETTKANLAWSFHSSGLFECKPARESRRLKTLAVTTYCQTRRRTSTGMSSSLSWWDASFSFFSRIYTLVKRQVIVRKKVRSRSGERRESTRKERRNDGWEEYARWCCYCSRSTLRRRKRVTKISTDFDSDE